jgi:hypothetical protein
VVHPPCAAAAAAAAAATDEATKKQRGSDVTAQLVLPIGPRADGRRERALLTIRPKRRTHTKRHTHEATHKHEATHQRPLKGEKSSRNSSSLLPMNRSSRVPWRVTYCTGELSVLIRAQSLSRGRGGVLGSHRRSWRGWGRGAGPPAS